MNMNKDIYTTKTSKGDNNNKRNTSRHLSQRSNSNLRNTHKNTTNSRISGSSDSKINNLIEDRFKVGNH